MECVTSDNWLYLDIYILHSLHYICTNKSIYKYLYIIFTYNYTSGCQYIQIYLDINTVSLEYLGISRNRQLTFEEHVKNKELDNGHQMDSNL